MSITTAAQCQAYADATPGSTWIGTIEENTNPKGCIRANGGNTYFNIDDDNYGGRDSCGCGGYGCPRYYDCVELETARTWTSTALSYAYGDETASSGGTSQLRREIPCNKCYDYSTSSKVFSGTQCSGIGDCEQKCTDDTNCKGYTVACSLTDKATEATCGTCDDSNKLSSTTCVDTCYDYGSSSKVFKSDGTNGGTCSSVADCEDKCSNDLTCEGHTAACSVTDKTTQETCGTCDDTFSGKRPGLILTAPTSSSTCVDTCYNYGTNTKIYTNDCANNNAAVQNGGMLCGGTCSSVADCKEKCTNTPLCGGFSEVDGSWQYGYWDPYGGPNYDGLNTAGTNYYREVASHCGNFCATTSKTTKAECIAMTAHTITTSTNNPNEVYAIDVDGDGDMDVLSASQNDDKVAWHENDGAGTFTTHTIATSADGPLSVYAADVDGDGDIDVLSASFNDDKIAWYENNGQANPTFTTHTISTNCDFARAVYAADVDGDGDMDVLSACQWDNKIAWYENNGAESFTEHVLSTSSNRAWDVAAVDLDGDGDIDILGSSYYDDKIRWYENDGASDPTFTTHTLSTSADEPRAIYTADVDGDGDMDVLSASYADNKIAWYENDGASDPTFTAHTITTSANEAIWVHAADVDGDGDMDVLSAENDWYNPPGSKLVWYENDGSESFTAHTIHSQHGGNINCVVAADVDGDGVLDVIGSAEYDDKLTWYENHGPWYPATPASRRFERSWTADTWNSNLGSVYAYGPETASSGGTSQVRSVASSCDGVPASRRFERSWDAATWVNIGSQFAYGPETASSGGTSQVRSAATTCSSSRTFERSWSALTWTERDWTTAWTVGTWHSNLASPYTYGPKTADTGGTSEERSEASSCSGIPASKRFERSWSALTWNPGTWNSNLASPYTYGPKTADSGGTSQERSALTGANSCDGILDSRKFERTWEPDTWTQRDWSAGAWNPGTWNSDLGSAYTYGPKTADTGGTSQERSALTGANSCDGILDSRKFERTWTPLTWTQRDWTAGAWNPGTWNSDLVSAYTYGPQMQPSGGTASSGGTSQERSAVTCDDSITDVKRYERDWTAQTWTARDWTPQTWQARQWTTQWTARSWTPETWQAHVWIPQTWSNRAWTTQWNDLTWTPQTWQARAWNASTWQDRAWTSEWTARSLSHAYGPKSADTGGAGDSFAQTAAASCDGVASNARIDRSWTPQTWVNRTWTPGTWATPSGHNSNIRVTHLDNTWLLDVGNPLGVAVHQKVCSVHAHGGGAFNGNGPTCSDPSKTTAAECVGGACSDISQTTQGTCITAGLVAHTITTSADGARYVYAVDVDGDGDMDVLSASMSDDTIRWYKNDGGTFTAHEITTSANGAWSVYAADVDGDGDMDVLSASYSDDTIAWYENDGSESFTAHTITTSADGASSVYAVDVDGDGDMDVLSAFLRDDTIRWYENDGQADPTFTAHTITTSADGAHSVYAADVDGDGDMDVLSASLYDDKIRWYENDGQTNPSFTTHEITDQADGARSVYAADVDGDGDMDVLSASSNDNTVRWYENDGAESFTAHEITTSADGVHSVYAVDVDGDGDMDVLSASERDDKIAWYENNGQAPQPTWTTHTITTGADGAKSVYAADVDGDGDMDVLSASQNNNKIAWYKNDNTWTSRTWTTNNGGCAGTITEHVSSTHFSSSTIYSYVEPVACAGSKTCEDGTLRAAACAGNSTNNVEVQLATYDISKLNDLQNLDRTVNDLTVDTLHGLGPELYANPLAKAGAATGTQTIVSCDFPGQVVDVSDGPATYVCTSPTTWTPIAGESSIALKGANPDTIVQNSGSYTDVGGVCYDGNGAKVDGGITVSGQVVDATAACDTEFTLLFDCAGAAQVSRKVVVECP